MKNIDWKTYKFHCSGLKNLMIEPRLKSESLSETTKSYLDEIFLKEVYGRTKTEMIANKYVRKGTMCETDSIELLESISSETYFKNQEMLSNDYVIGTPDIITADKIIDIKTSWDLFTFFKSSEETAEKDYYYQLLGYMWLTKKNSSELVYALVNTPDELINDEVYRLKFYMSEDEAQAYTINYIFDDIEKNQRIKRYSFKANEADIEAVKCRIEACREYLVNLKL